MLRDKRQRQGRNPQTGDPIVITERRVLSFKASQLLKQALNDTADNPQGAGPGLASVMYSDRPSTLRRNGSANHE